MKKPVSGVDGLTVDHDIPLPEHKVMPGNKYGDLFAKLKPKSSIGCEPADVGRLQNALRAEVERLRGALGPFANYACPEPCDCHNCKARAALKGGA